MGASAVLMFSVLVGWSEECVSCCSNWATFSNTNNVYGQVTGSCKEPGKQPNVASPCFAGIQAGHQTGVTDTTYIEFGIVDSFEACEAAASASPLQPPCASITWHSPECKGCGTLWMKHCYCATTQIWLKDPGNPLAAQANQEGVQSAKCMDLGCSGGWTLVAVILGFVGMYLGVGAAYRIKTVGATGKAIIPHLTFWMEVQALVQDGVAFARGGNRRSARTKSLYGSEAETDADGRERKRSKDKKKHKKEKYGHVEKKGGNAGRQEERSLLGSARHDNADADSESAVSAVAAAPAMRTAAAGGGGRWVHVSS